MKNIITQIIVSLGQGNALQAGQRFTATAIRKLGSVGVAAVAIIGALSAFIWKSVSAYASKQSVMARLTQAMISAGVYTQRLAEQYQGLAREYAKKTIFSESDILSAQAFLQELMGGQEVTRETLVAVMDYSAGAGIPLEAAAKKLGKTLVGGRNAMKGYGIELEKNAEEGEKLGAATEGIRHRFEGQAEAQTKGLGVIGLLKKAIVGFLELIGTALAPAVIAIVGHTKNAIDEIEKADAVMDAIGGVADTGLKLGFIIKGVVVSLWTLLANSLTSVSGMLARALTGRFDEILPWLMEKAQSSLDTITSEHEKAKQGIADVNAERARSEDEAAKRKSDALAEYRARLAAQQAKEAEDERALFESRSEDDLLRQLNEEELRRDADYLRLNDRWMAEKNLTEKRKLELEKRRMIDDKMITTKHRYAKMQQDLNAVTAGSKLDFAAKGWAVLSEASARFGEIVALQKAVSIGQIAYNTALTVAATWRWFSPIPIIGQILAAIFSAAAIIYGLEQAARVAGVRLAEGGIVSRGTVEKLPRDAQFFQRIDVTVQGGLSGTDDEARMIIDAIRRAG